MPARPGLPSLDMDEDELDKAFREERLRKFQEQFPFRPAKQGMVEEEVARKLREQFGIPIPKKTAGQGVSDMQARIEMVKDDKAKTLDPVDEANGHHLDELSDILNRLNKDLARA